MVNIVVNNVVLVKQPQAIHLAISETGSYRQTKHVNTYHVNNIVNIVLLVKYNKQPQAIYYYGDIDVHVTN